MYDRTVTSYIVLVDIAIFVRKRLVYYIIVLKETGDFIFKLAFF